MADDNLKIIIHLAIWFYGGGLSWLSIDDHTELVGIAHQLMAETMGYV